MALWRLQTSHLSVHNSLFLCITQRDHMDSDSEYSNNSLPPLDDDELSVDADEAGQPAVQPDDAPLSPFDLWPELRRDVPVRAQYAKEPKKSDYPVKRPTMPVMTSRAGHSKTCSVCHRPKSSWQGNSKSKHTCSTACHSFKNCPSKSVYCKWLGWSRDLFSPPVSAFALSSSVVLRSPSRFYQAGARGGRHHL